MTTEQLGCLGQITIHRVGSWRIGGIDVYGLGCSLLGVVVVALDAAETILIINCQPLEQGMIHAI